MGGNRGKSNFQGWQKQTPFFCFRRKQEMNCSLEDLGSHMNMEIWVLGSAYVKSSKDEDK